LPGHLSKIHRATLRTTPESSAIKHDRELSKSNMRSASSATRIFSTSRNNPAAAIIAALIVEIAGGRFAFPRERQQNLITKLMPPTQGGQAASKFFASTNAP
jgi:hypothetical protein